VNAPDPRPALTACAWILADEGHESGLAGQLTARGLEPGTYWTLPLGVAFDEADEAAWLLIDDRLAVRAGDGAHGLREPNPATRFHLWVYRARPDVRAIVHSHSPSVIPFGATGAPLRPLYHMSAFLSGGVPVWDIGRAAGGATDMLVRTPALGHALAQALGARPVVLMRGHGAVVVGTSLPQVVFRSVYTEVNARLQVQAIALGGGNVTYLSPEEAAKAEGSIASTLGRPWELWKRKALAH